MIARQLPDGEQRVWALAPACPECGSTMGVIVKRSDQNCLYCAACHRYQGRNVPKVDTGESTRSVSSRVDVPPKLRARVLERDGFTCYTCGRRPPDIQITVGHLLSDADGQRVGATPAELLAEYNLVAQCEECNLGQGDRSIAPAAACRLQLLIQRARAAGDR